ncbi:MAG: class I SAM-dependent methyltransferase [Cyclobacteriaceae bacterium]|nr:class I SAM-dependent methyltransferase [Cyclobacteriaceae bacterium]
MENSKEHWEKIYSTKQAHEVSWTQEIPETSLNFIHGFNVPKNSAIIDVGGGESKFVDFLLDEGYIDITVLDISEQALKKTQARLGERASKVKWIVSDVTKFKPIVKFDVWHDRATFHFLNTKDQIEKYIELAAQCVNSNGFLAIGTFSENGPTKCSGLDIKQYSESELEKTLTYFTSGKFVASRKITLLHSIQFKIFCFAALKGRLDAKKNFNSPTIGF